MVKISSATQKELICLCGLCDHEPFDPKCPYNMMVDKKNPSEEMHKRILTLMKKEILTNINSVKKANGQSKQTKRK